MHRLNVEAEFAEEAVAPGADLHSSVRRDFVKNCPDVVQYMIAFRTELMMKMVMPALVPNSEREREVFVDGAVRVWAEWQSALSRFLRGGWEPVLGACAQRCGRRWQR